ncbi:hypothetical protein KJA17_00160 [Patescibacteria group bacterium]|nr:hypothetical protein [Patescibacteria group bacterium]
MAKPFKSQPKIPHKAPEPPKPEPKKDIFGKKGSVTRPELREELRRAPAEIPDSGKKFYRRKREKLEKEIFGKRYGTHISREEFKYRLSKLRKESFKTKSFKKKQDIRRKIRYLKKLGGF